MKKLIAVCTAIAILAVSGVSASAQAMANDKLSIVSGSTLNKALSSEMTSEIDRDDVKEYLCAIEIYNDIFGKYLDDEEKTTLQTYMTTLENIANGSDSSLSADEKTAATFTFINAVFLFAQATEEVSLDQQLSDILTVAKKDYNTLSDGDLKTYMGKLLSTDTSNMTDDEKNNYGSSLIMCIFFIRKNANFSIGDIDMDGSINSVDVFMILRSSAKLEELQDYESFLADTNGDGRVTAADGLIIQRHIAGYQTNLKK